MMRSLAILLVALSLLGCAKIDIESYVDPLYQEGYGLDKTLVSAPDLRLGERELLESRLAASLSERGIPALRGLDLFPPTREFTPEEHRGLLDRHGVKSVLLMGEYEASTTAVYIPPTYHPGISTTTVSYVGNRAVLRTWTWPGFMTGGYTTEKHRYSYSWSLHDRASDRTVWVADVMAERNANSDPERFADRSARAAVDELIAQGFLD